MDSGMIQSAIHNPTPEAASAILSDITPDIIGDIMPSIFAQVDSGVDSEVLAENSVDQILNIVENTILGENVDFVIDKFGQRIVDMLTGETMLSIFERVAMMVVSGSPS